MIKADVYSYVHSILFHPRPTPRPPSPRHHPSPSGGLCHRMGALQPRYLHITGVRRAGNRPSKYRSPLFSSLYASLSHRLPLPYLLLLQKGETLSLYLSHANISKDRDERAGITGRRVIIANRFRKILISKRRKRN